MSRFYTLKMAREVAEHPMIADQEHLFGLIHNVVYKPTSSKIESYSNYYAEEDARLFKNLIEGKDDNLKNELDPLAKVMCSDSSLFRLDLCVSHDCQFIAMQLNHVNGEEITHITPIRYFEGNDALAVNEIFN